MACTLRLVCRSHDLLQLDSTFVLSSHSSGHSFFYFVHCDLDQYILLPSLQLFVSLDHSDYSSTILDHPSLDSLSAASDFNSYLYVHLPRSFARLVVYSDILHRSSDADAHVALRTSPEWNPLEIDLLADNPFVDGRGRRPRVDLPGKHLDLSSSPLFGNLFITEWNHPTVHHIYFNSHLVANHWLSLEHSLEEHPRSNSNRKEHDHSVVTWTFVWLDSNTACDWLSVTERQVGVHFSLLSSCSRWTITRRDFECDVFRSSKPHCRRRVWLVNDYFVSLFSLCLSLMKRSSFTEPFW